MSKAILIGNGFTSNLIEEYKDINMMKIFIKLIPELIDRVEKSFETFRNFDLNSNDLFSLTEAIFCGQNLFCGSNTFPSSDGIHIQEEPKIWVINKLKKLGFSKPNEIFNEYFDKYGLIYLINSNRINGVESYLKVVHMFIEINLFGIEDYNKIKTIANKIYYNNGNHGITSINNKTIDLSKLSSLITGYNDIYTTNYDTILDDLLENQNRFPYHLHGGFSIDHQNKNPDGRYTPDKAYLVWGYNSEIKYNTLKIGFDFSNLRLRNNELRFGNSLLADYFDYLRDRNYEEIHIVGFSGENDDHINKRIRENPNLKNIIVYVNPAKLNKTETIVKNRLLFSGDNKAVHIKPWDEFWNIIKIS